MLLTWRYQETSRRWILLPLAAFDLTKAWSWQGCSIAHAANIAVGTAVTYVEVAVRYLQRLPVCVAHN